MKHIIHVLSILICAVALVGCKDKIDSSQDIRDTEPNLSVANELPSSESTLTPAAEPNEPPSSESAAAPPADSFEIVGNITYKNIEGGFYAIDGDNGRKYDPINLPESFRKDGLRVKVTARPRMDAMSLHMYGAIIEIVNIAAQ